MEEERRTAATPTTAKTGAGRRRVGDGNEQQQRLASPLRPSPRLAFLVLAYEQATREGFPGPGAARGGNRSAKDLNKSRKRGGEDRQTEGG